MKLKLFLLGLHLFCIPSRSLASTVAAPDIVDTSGNTIKVLTGAVGSLLRFQCKASDGSTVVETAWYKDDTTPALKQGPNENIFSIRNPSEDDFGTYTCKIKVGSSWSQNSASLAVYNCENTKKALGMQSFVIRRLQISASGVPANSRILENLRFGDETGGTEKTGLCIDASLKEKRITIDFQSGANKFVLLTGHAAQTWKNWKAGATPADDDPYVKEFKMSYEGADGKVHQAKAAFPAITNIKWTKTNKYHYSPADKYILMGKIFLDVTTKYHSKPCVRLEFFGCPQVLCNPPCKNGGKCIAKNTCKCEVPFGPPDKQCKYEYPETVQTPTLVTVDAGNNEVKFQCKVTPVTGQKFTADFYVDENKIEPIYSQPNPTDGDIAGQFNQQDLYIFKDGNGDPIFSLMDDNRKSRMVYRIQKGIRCAVRACYTKDNSCEFVKSPQKSSKFLTGTAKVDKTSITLTEGGGPETLTVTFDGPPILFQDLMDAAHTRTAHLEVQFAQTPRKYRCHENQAALTEVDHHGTAPSNQHCGPAVNSENWHKSSFFLLKILATMDGLYIATTVQRKAKVVVKHIKDDKKISSKDVADIDVSVINSDGWGRFVRNINCYSNGDPWQRTFDGTYYGAHFVSEAVSYINKVDGNQVNGYFKPCRPGSSATCNCAVAVKSGDDVIVVSYDCYDDTTINKRKGKYLRAHMWLNGELTPGFRIYGVGTGWADRYYIYLPSGTYVQVNPKLQSYHVIPSLGDRDNTEGLCGYYDGACKDDLRDRSGKVYLKSVCHAWYHHADYSSVWTATQKNGMSIVYGVPAGDKFADQRKKVYCRCVLDSHTSDCGEHVKARPCLPKDAKDITDELKEHFSYTPKSVKTKVRRRRSVDEFLDRSERAVADPAGEDDVYRSFIFDASFVAKDVSWPTPGGWTEAKARTFCEDYLLNNEAVKNCKTMMSSDFKEEVNSCMLDIKVTDGTDFAEATLKTILSQCVTMVDQYPSDVTDLPGNIKRTVLLSSLCLNNCNNNGKCDDGRCACNAGFFGSMCSLTKDKPPEISYLSRDGLCNTRGRDCTRSEVFGSGYIESSDLKCRITPYNHLTGKRDDSNQFTTTAQYINMNLILCPHDKKNGTFMVAVSNNNGGTYSTEELLYLAYDGICYTCTIDQDNKRGNCSRLDTGCGIGKACFKAEQLDPESKCRICDPIRSVSSWSVNTKLSRCTPTPVDNTLAIALGVTTGVVFMVAVIGILFGAKKCKPKSVGPPAEAESDGIEPVEEAPAPETSESVLSGSTTSVNDTGRRGSSASVTNSGRRGSSASVAQIAWTP